MKSTILSLLAVASVGALTAAPVSKEEIPGPVSQSIQKYFPGSTHLSAETDKKKGETVYEVKVQYLDLVLEVDLTSEGKVLDVELDEQKK